MPKIIDFVEYTETDDGWQSRKVHDGGEFVMERRDADRIVEDVEAIQGGQRPSWTLLGLPSIVVNGAVFRERDEV